MQAAQLMQFTSCSGCQAAQQTRKVCVSIQRQSGCRLEDMELPRSVAHECSCGGKAVGCGARYAATSLKQRIWAQIAVHALSVPQLKEWLAWEREISCSLLLNAVVGWLRRPCIT